VDAVSYNRSSGTWRKKMWCLALLSLYPNDDHQINSWFPEVIHLSYSIIIEEYSSLYQLKIPKISMMMIAIDDDDIQYDFNEDEIIDHDNEDDITHDKNYIHQLISKSLPSYDISYHSNNPVVSNPTTEVIINNLFTPIETLNCLFSKLLNENFITNLKIHLILKEKILLFQSNLSAENFTELISLIGENIVHQLLTVQDN
jgi:hypothetical protein